MLYNFTPNYTNILHSAQNKRPKRLPLYEHAISEKVMEQILGEKFKDLYNGNANEKHGFFSKYTDFFKKMGYDTVSFEKCITSIMPGGGALYGHKEGAIKNRQDFETYPWNEIHDIFFKKYENDFELLKKVMPKGMKAIGGPGNGVFECVQDIVGYSNLCYILADDQDLFKDLFNKIAKVMYKIWETFLRRFGDVYVVCRFGDDLGFKSSTLISPEDIKRVIIPKYAQIIKLIHSYNKPFLLHSCGNIFNVMDDIIDVAKIDAKHSNEDQIAPFSTWVDKYNLRIGLFGGIDTDILCRKDTKEIKEYVKDVINHIMIHGRGNAIGSGNSIPDYVPAEGFLTMVETVREMRGDFQEKIL